MRHHSLSAVLFTVGLSAQAGYAVPTLEPVLNSTAADTGPQLSFDQLTLHFASFRSGNWEIYSSTRSAVGQPWTAPVQETALGGTTVEDQPWMIAFQTELWFSSTNRAGGSGGSDLMVAQRAGPGLPWGTPAFVPELNSSLAESAPSLTADGLEIFYLSTGFGNPAGTNNSIYTSHRPAIGMPFYPPVLVAALSNGNTHRDVDISPDGLTIVYTEFVSSMSRLRVMFAERTSRTAPWSVPVPLTEFDTVGATLGTYSISRSAHGTEAILAAGFPTAAGGQELLATTFTGATHLSPTGLGQTMSIGVHDPARPGFAYAIGAALGNTGFPLGARTVPLDPDWLLLGSLGANIPGWTQGWSGLLDAQGNAYGYLTNPDPVLTGLQIWVGALVWDNAAPFGVGTVTNSFPVVFQP